MSEDKARPGPGWSLAIDYGPLLTFFLAYKFQGVMVGTAVFMLAIAAALLVSRIKLGHVSPMLWLSAVLVIGFGSLTIWYHDTRFIQIKVTLIYSLFTLILGGGLLAGKPMMKYLLQAAFENLDDAGWMKLSRNWAIFFFAMAVLNELLRAKLSFDAWLTIKTWGVTVASVLFGIANVPMLMRHGLAADDNKMVLPPE